ncbi:hypothetical protein FPE01S_02_08780 [Flavihumibacter petaseus NBRC 106054]|uniref:Uncharacterized protein n=2 Tax=Flavihumibacter TaxID=1004301 RepID=A0A0E9N165_9BACT|nr:hypothetical protein FPE01S_02_08780 [Flavihumibacter petaseus NBRC 106054]
MVQAILNGRKTQTRRVVKGTALEWLDRDGFVKEYVALPKNELCPYGNPGDFLWVREEFYQIGHWKEVPGVKTKTGKMKWKFVPDNGEIRYSDNRPETFRKGRHHKDPSTSVWHKRLARFMPRSACRLFLKVTNIRVERLQDISTEDVRKEGAGQNVRQMSLYGLDAKGIREVYATHFSILWTSINGEESWNSNPWVWVVSFERTDKPESF